jgi:ATP/maltotriose-dependent transcriptional regulator MalT/DNA-binding SARP family transcriptional activator
MRTTNRLGKTRFSLPPRYLPRRDLDASVKQGLHKRLLLVVAPPGYGKSTAVAHAVAGLQGPVLWYTFDHSDFSVALLTRILAERLGEISGCSFPFPLAPDASPLDCAQFFTRCIERAAPQGVHLVLDDFDQSPAQDAATSFLQHLLDLGPRQLRVAVTAAGRPNLDLSSVASEGDLARIGQERLRYRPSEVAHLLKASWGAVPDELADWVLRATGGWPAGLALLLMAYPERPPPSELLPSNSDKSDETDYDIIQHLTGPDRQLLCTMAICPIVDPDDLQELLDRSDAEARARRLVERSALFRSAGTAGYVMLPAARDQFVALAEREWGPEAVADKRRRVATLLERKGHLDDALSLFLEVRDVAGVNRVLRSLGVGKIQDWDAARVIAVSARLEDLPGLGPEGLLLCARANGARGNMQACDRYCAAALRQVERRAAPRLFLTLSAIQANARSFPDTAGSAEELWSSVRDQFAAAEADRGWYQLWFASFLIRTGKLVEGEKELRNAISILRETGTAAQVGWALNRLADLQIKRGRYRSALTTLRRASPTSRHAGTFQAMVNRYLFAQVNRFQGKLQEAQEHLNHAAELAGLADASWALFSFHLLLMEIALWRRDLITARHLCDEAESIMSRQPFGTRGRHSLSSAKARLAAASGADNEAFEAFSEVLELEAESEHERAWDAVHASLFFFRTGRHGEAAQALAGVLRSARRMGASHLWANALLLRARLSDARGDRRAAMRDLRHFWRRVVRHGFRFMPVSDTELLEWAETSSPHDVPSERCARSFLRVFSHAPPRAKKEARPQRRRVSIGTFGPLRISVQGVPVGEHAWRSNVKGKRLLELLLSSRSFRVSADEAVELLWPTAPASKVRHRLHTTVTRLRTALDEMGIQDQVQIGYEDSFYRLAVSGDVAIDHVAFQSLAERGLAEARHGRHRCAHELLTKAVAIYSGTFLQDALYERFTDFRRDQLSELVSGVYHALAASPVVPAEEALRWWEKAVDHDPYDESGYQGAIECCLELAMHGKARSVYSTMKRRLVDELGVPTPAWAEEIARRLGQPDTSPTT